MASTGQVAPQNQRSTAKVPLRVASHVVELEIPGIRPPETYEKGVTADIPDPRAARLGRITEDDEYDNWQDDFNARFDGLQRTIS